MSLRKIAGLAAAFSVEGIREFISGMFETAKGIRDVAEQFDISTTSVQKWEKAVAKAGIGTATFYRSLEAFRQKRADAVGGAGLDRQQRGHILLGEKTKLLGDDNGRGIGGGIGCRRGMGGADWIPFGDAGPLPPAGTRIGSPHFRHLTNLPACSALTW